MDDIYLINILMNNACHSPEESEEDPDNSMNRNTCALRVSL
jgi:hypothetical protein